MLSKKREKESVHLSFPRSIKPSSDSSSIFYFHRPIGSSTGTFRFSLARRRSSDYGCCWSIPHNYNPIELAWVLSRFIVQQIQVLEFAGDLYAYQDLSETDWTHLCNLISDAAVTTGSMTQNDRRRITCQSIKFLSGIQNDQQIQVFQAIKPNHIEFVLPVDVKVWKALAVGNSPKECQEKNIPEELIVSGRSTMSTYLTVEDCQHMVHALHQCRGLKRFIIRNVSFAQPRCCDCLLFAFTSLQSLQQVTWENNRVMPTRTINQVDDDNANDSKRKTTVCCVDEATQQNLLYLEIQHSLEALSHHPKQRSWLERIHRLEMIHSVSEVLRCWMSNSQSVTVEHPAVDRIAHQAPPHKDPMSLSLRISRLDKNSSIWRDSDTAILSRDCAKRDLASGIRQY